MGKKLDALLGKNVSLKKKKLGKNVNTSKLTPLVNLAIARLAMFKNQRQMRCNLARSDVVQGLQRGHHKRALHKHNMIARVILEQNMLDVYVMLEGHCNLLVERTYLIEQERECPEELKEAVATLLYGSTRCGDFPELQEIRAVISSRYGREFVARAMELRNNCGVNPTMIQKLSTWQASDESRMKALKEIASENNISLQLGEDSASTEETLERNEAQNQSTPRSSTPMGSSNLGGHSFMSLDSEKDGVSDSFKPTKYKDVADAAQAAFESAAYAAEAARAAVELSRSNYHDSNDHNSPKAVARESSLKNNSTDDLGTGNNKVHDEKDTVKLKNKGLAEPKMPESSSSDAEDIVKNVGGEIVLEGSGDEDHVQDFNGKPNDPESKVSETDDRNKHIPTLIQAGLKVESGDGSSVTDNAEKSRNIFSQMYKLILIKYLKVSI